jgi:hypothetical protein
MCYVDSDAVARSKQARATRRALLRSRDQQKPNLDRRHDEDAGPARPHRQTGAAKAAGDTSAVPKLLAATQQLNAEHPTHYGAAWVALGWLMLTTSGLQPCSS